jgi:hypothetical protein
VALAPTFCSRLEPFDPPKLTTLHASSEKLASCGFDEIKQEGVRCRELRGDSSSAPNNDCCQLPRSGFVQPWLQPPEFLTFDQPWLQPPEFLTFDQLCGVHARESAQPPCCLDERHITGFATKRFDSPRMFGSCDCHDRVLAEAADRLLPGLLSRLAESSFAWEGLSRWKSG